MKTTTRRVSGGRPVIGRRMHIAVALAAAAAVAGFVAVGVAHANSSDNRVPAGYPLDKAARLQHEIDQVTNLPKRQKPTENEGRVAAAGKAGADPARVAGINNAMHQGPFPAAQFRVRNFYQGPVAGQWYLVYAGSLVDASTGADHAAIRVLSLSSAGRLASVGTFQAPAGSTSLRLTAYTGSRLTMQGDGGQVLTFDLLSLSYS